MIIIDCARYIHLKLLTFLMDHDGPFAITNFLKAVKPIAPESPNIQPDFILGNKLSVPQAPSPSILESLFSSSQHRHDRKHALLNSSLNISISDLHDTNLSKTSAAKSQTVQTLRDDISTFPLKEKPSTKQTLSTEHSIQTALESVLLPAVSAACTQYMDQLTEIFKVRLKRVLKQQTITPLDGDEPHIQLLIALQKQDPDQVLRILNEMDKIGNLFSYLSIPRLFDILSILTGFLSEYFQLESNAETYLPFKESDAISMALPWILETLIAIRYMIQKQPSLFSYPISCSRHPHSCYILKCLKDQLYIIQSNFPESMDNDHEIKMNSIFHILDSIWTDTE